MAPRQQPGPQQRHRSSRSLTIVLGIGLALSLSAITAHAAGPVPILGWGDKGEALRATVQEAFINFRTGPGRGYPIFYIAERGEVVEVLKQRTDWVKVRNVKDIEGWVHVDEMVLTNDQNDQPLAVDRANRESYTQRRWEMGSLMGDFGGSSVITAYGGYHLTRNVSLEGALSETFGDFSNGRSATLSIVHQPFPTWSVSPFLTIGGGVRETNPRSTLVTVEDREDDMLNAGVGVRSYLGRRFILRLQYKNYTVLTDRDDDEEVDEWKIGLSTFF